MRAAGSTEVDLPVNLRVTRCGPSPTYRDDVQRLWRHLPDAALALAVTAAGLAEVWVPFSSVQGDGSEVATSVAILVSGAALSQRRVHPLAVQLVVCFSWFAVMLVTPTLVTFFGQFIPMGIAVFATARHGRGREPLLGAAAAALALLCVDVLVPDLQSPGEMVFHWGAITLVWVLGYRLSRLEQRSRESTRRAIDAEVAAAEQALAAVVEERTRIARELHDIVAHCRHLDGRPGRRRGAGRRGRPGLRRDGPGAASANTGDGGARRHAPGGRGAAGRRRDGVAGTAARAAGRPGPHRWCRGGRDRRQPARSRARFAPCRWAWTWRRTASSRSR